MIFNDIDELENINLLALQNNSIEVTQLQYIIWIWITDLRAGSLAAVARPLAEAQHAVAGVGTSEGGSLAAVARPPTETQHVAGVLLTVAGHCPFLAVLVSVFTTAKTYVC